MTKGEQSRIAARKALKEYRPTVPTGRRLPDGTMETERKSFYYAKSESPATQAANLQAAKDAAREYSRRLRFGGDPLPGLVRGTVDWYLQERIAPLHVGDRPSTGAAVQYAADLLSDHAGNMMVRGMGAAEIARIVAKVGGSASRRNKVRNLAYQVNEIAAEEDPEVRLVSRRRVKAVKTRAPRIEVQSPRDCLAVALSVPPQYRIGALLQAVYGARAGESSAPIWSDVTPLGTLRIERQDDRHAGVSEDLKSEESRRELPIPAGMLAVLEAHRREERSAGRGRPSDPINATRNGTPVTETRLREAVKAARRRLGMPEYPGRPCHVFRHSLASWLDREGCPQGIRLAILGQSRDAVRDRYVHATTADMAPWVERWWQAAQGAEGVERPRLGGAKAPATGARNGRYKGVDRKAPAILEALAVPGATVMGVARSFGISPKAVRSVREADRASTGQVVAATTPRGDRVPSS